MVDLRILPFTVISTRMSIRKGDTKSPLLLLVRMGKAKVAEDNETVC